MVLSEDTGRVRLLTLNRPQALNAFNGALFDALTEALIAADGFHWFTLPMNNKT